MVGALLVCGACSHLDAIFRDAELADIVSSVELEGTAAALNSYKFSGELSTPQLTFQGRIFRPRATPVEKSVPRVQWQTFSTIRRHCFSATIKTKSPLVQANEMAGLVEILNYELSASLAVLAEWHTRIYGEFGPCLDLVFYLVPPEEAASLRVSVRTDAGRLEFPVLGNLPVNYGATRQWARDAIATAAHEIFHLRSFQSGGFADPVSEEAAAYLQQWCVELKLSGAVGPTFVRLGSAGDGAMDRAGKKEILALLGDNDLHPTIRGLLLAQVIFASDISAKQVELGSASSDKFSKYCEQIGRAKPPLLAQCLQGSEICRTVRGE